MFLPPTKIVKHKRKCEFFSTVKMPRPRDSSYKSYRLINEALSSGPKYFEELVGITNLHRNTLAARLKFLQSKGFVAKERQVNRVYYRIIEPLKDANGHLRIEGLKWLNYLISPEDERQRKSQLKAIIREQIEDRKLRSKVYEDIANFHESLDRLVSRPESQEILEYIENWQTESAIKVFLI
jgi:DNA-binding HxlR family transcriptional regulator